MRTLSLPTLHGVAHTERREGHENDRHQRVQALDLDRSERQSGTSQPRDEKDVGESARGGFLVPGRLDRILGPVRGTFEGRPIHEEHPRQRRQ
ncbi:hypothetical protein NJ76_04795 [Rhodococcus sp. IITR03]|nr:hypothetical protein NJ76_04795 [Rhodococcus sp. IITR03]